MIVVICPTTQEEMCTTGSLRMGLCVALSAPLRTQAKQSSFASTEIVWIASSLSLLAMTTERIRRTDKGAQATCPPSLSLRIAVLAAQPRRPYAAATARFIVAASSSSIGSRSPAAAQTRMFLAISDR